MSEGINNEYVTTAVGAAVGAVVTKLVDFVTCRDSREIRLELRAKIADVQIGCPAVVFTLCNKGERVAKVKAIYVGVRGEGFMKGLQKGFTTDLGHNTPDDPELRTEMYKVYGIPMDEQSDKYGWILERDSVCQFAWPIAAPLALPAATHNPDSVFVNVILFDDEEREMMSGEDMQGLIQEPLDYAFKKGLQCRADVNIEVTASSTVFPAIDVAGIVNDKPIPAPVGEPWASDIQFGNGGTSAS